MKASELRIGNKIFYDSCINEGVVDVFSVKILTHRIDINGRPQSYYKPIPLTEEILLKCGFKKHIKLGGHDGYLLNGWFITTDFCFMVLGSSVILSKIKYLHQLQNLYFVLTGKELIIEP